ncbi:hypothetical protein IJS77_04470 [bacterium]|nr:hypothetical protein [bacterium]
MADFGVKNFVTKPLTPANNNQLWCRDISKDKLVKREKLQQMAQLAFKQTDNENYA